jgi:endonuclease/exonuclease/phosphatase family metal-dependent hydrolase
MMYIFGENTFMRYCLLVFLLSFSVDAICGGSANDTASREISIMTYNIKMLPRGANSFIHHFPVRRAKLIPGKLITEGVDVIVFQEAFDGLADRILRRMLKPLYPYCMGFQNRKVVSYKRAGGVLIFSKYPMTELESIKYTQCKGIDCAGNKGALLVEVRHPAGKFQLFGTHMQAGGGKDLKESQYAEAGALLKRHEQQGVPQFAAGDFNTKKTDPNLYDTLVRALDAQDGMITGDLQYTSDHLLNDMDSYNPEKRNVIDYVFCRPNGVKVTDTRRYVRKFEQPWHSKHKDLSDHFAVVLKTHF